MLESKVLTVTINRDWKALYEAFWEPERFARWASGLSEAGLARTSDGWKAQGPEGPVSIRFTDHNAYGVMDHWVEIGDGRLVYIPLRIIANGAGADVMLTLFRQPEMSDAKFAEDEAWVRRDLDALKRLAEA